MIPNSTDYLFYGGNSMLSIKKCQGCGVMCDSAMIYYNPVLQKETCYFERQKQINQLKRQEVKNEI
jgi:hypothetical protein